MFDIAIYFFQRIIFYFKDFIRAYFLGVFEYFNSSYWDRILLLDRVTSFSINIRYFWVPLWRYYTVMAYIVSIPIRLLKILFGGLIMIIFSIVYWLLYIIWVALPFYLIFKIFR